MTLFPHAETHEPPLRVRLPLMFRGFFNREPTTFIAALVLWAFFNGVSLVLPGAAFDATPIYSDLAKLPISEGVWGSIMLLDAAALIVAVVPGMSLTYRVFVMALSAGLWVFIGAEVLLGAAAAPIPFFSAGGAWEACVGLKCIIAGVQWVRQRSWP